MSTGLESRFQIEKRGEVALVILSNQKRRNILDPQLIGGLIAAISDLGKQGARALVLTSDGPVFSGGYDVGTFPDIPEDSWLRCHGNLQELGRLLSDGPMPTVAGLTGPAVGAGCELALSCDLRVAHEKVTLCLPPVKIGIVYNPEAVARLIALCGGAVARRLLLTAQPVAAAAAAHFGLIDEIVSDFEVREAAIRHAQKLAAMPQTALLGTRTVIERILAEGPNLSPASSDEIYALRKAAWQSQDAQAVRSQFRQKRAPG